MPLFRTVKIAEDYMRYALEHDQLWYNEMEIPYNEAGYDEI